MRPCAAALLASLLAGCATQMSTLQTAETTPKHHVDVSAGIGAYVPVTHSFRVAAALTDAGISGAKAVAKAAKDEQNDKPVLTDAQKQALISGGLGLAAGTPDYMWQLAARFGILDNWDVGARFGMGQLELALGLDTKYRFWDWKSADGDIRQGVAADLRLQKTWISNPVLDVLDFVQLGDFSRYDAELTGLYTIDLREIFKIYGGLRYRFVHFSADETTLFLANRGMDLAGLPHVAEEDSFNTNSLETVVGVAIGYKRVHLMLELNSGYTWFRPVLFGQQRNLDNFSLYPAIGIGGWI